jgi:hypothetical protein
MTEKKKVDQVTPAPGEEKLHPAQKEILESVLEDNPNLTRAEALEALIEAGL